jgi:hypothetical protein
MRSRDDPFGSPADASRHDPFIVPVRLHDRSSAQSPGAAGSSLRLADQTARHDIVCGVRDRFALDVDP